MFWGTVRVSVTRTGGAFVKLLVLVLVFFRSDNAYVGVHPMPRRG